MNSTVYAVTGYDVGGNSGEVICALFSNREAAEQYVAQDTVGQCAFSGGFTPLDIEEMELRTDAPTPYAYWHRGAEVYPDGSVREWCDEHSAQGEYMRDAEDDLEPWDGHTQGHCGLHISLFGADRDELEAKFQRQLADAIAASTGTCKCGRTDIYQAGFWGETREASNQESRPE